LCYSYSHKFENICYIFSTGQREKQEKFFFTIVPTPELVDC